MLNASVREMLIDIVTLSIRRRNRDVDWPRGREYNSIKAALLKPETRASKETNSRIPRPSNPRENKLSVMLAALENKHRHHVAQ